MVSCCRAKKNSKKCTRKDKKVFLLPRKYTKKQCLKKKIRGYSKKSSCAPYKYCKKNNFLFNPDNPKKSFDVYVDKNPKDTIHIKYTTVSDVKKTIDKLEMLYKQKKYSHKRIWQVGMIMKVRLESMYKRKNKYPNAKNLRQRYLLSKKYFEFLGERSKKKTFKERKSMFF